MAIPIVPITDHKTQGKARLPGWLVNATNLKLFLDVLIQPAQDVDDLFIELLNEVSITTAVGVQLDVIGIILGLSRSSVSEPDDEYRTRLIGQASALSQSGEPETVIQAWKLIWSANSVLLEEFQPATLALTAFLTVDPNDPDFDAAAIVSMQAVIAAGVGTMLLICVEPCFLWGDSANADANGELLPAATGFGDETDADINGEVAPGIGGGNLARVI